VKSRLWIINKETLLSAYLHSKSEKTFSINNFLTDKVWLSGEYYDYYGHVCGFISQSMLKKLVLTEVLFRRSSTKTGRQAGWEGLFCTNALNLLNHSLVRSTVSTDQQCHWVQIKPVLSCRHAVSTSRSVVYNLGDFSNNGLDMFWEIAKQVFLIWTEFLVPLILRHFKLELIIGHPVDILLAK